MKGNHTSAVVEESKKEKMNIPKGAAALLMIGLISLIGCPVYVLSRMTA